MASSVRKFIVKYIGDLFFSRRWYLFISLCSLLFLLRFFLAWMGNIPFVALAVAAALALIDYFSLFFTPGGVVAVRTHAERLSNGDENPIRIDLENFYAFTAHIELIDEIPSQFQLRDLLFRVVVPMRESRIIRYRLRPLKRGEYSFGRINVYVSGPIHLLKRRFRLGQPTTVPVYPSYIQMRKYQLVAIHNRLSDLGVKRMRRIGHSMEFEQIKEYVPGDDYRTLNWKATARKGQLMVNHYTDEKSQQVYCVIDKSRVMKMPFGGLSLLDYAINASLVLSNAALLKQDKAGLVTFAEKIGTFLGADRKSTQMQSILETLYKQKTRYLESDFEKLYAIVRARITQRSLLILFTNFETVTGLRRQLPYLRNIARHHLLLIVFFENTELGELIDKDANDIETIYTKTIAEKFYFEKKQIVMELQQYGILSILTRPSQVTVNALNKYLELKARQAI